MNKLSRSTKCAGASMMLCSIVLVRWLVNGSEEMTWDIVLVLIVIVLNGLILTTFSFEKNVASKGS